MADNAPAKAVNLEAEFSALMARLDVEADMNDDEGSLESWIRNKLATIASADDFAAINAAMEGSGLKASKDLVGHTFEILDLGVKKSTKDGDGNGVGSQLKKYAIVKAVDVSSGEELIIDGGGDQFVSGLVRMRDLYDFPFTGTLLGTTTGSGNTLLSWRFMDPKRAKIQ
jgi:hypothetical protein